MYRVDFDPKKEMAAFEEAVKAKAHGLPTKAEFEKELKERAKNLADAEKACA